MSEPDSAFLQLRICRGSLIRWLDGPIRPAGNWTDWRAIGGTYYFADGLAPIADVSDAVLAENISACDTALRRLATNRDGLRWVLQSAEAPCLKRCVYDAQTGVFLAGSLTFDDNLLASMQFLTLARGAAEALDPDGSGIALLHNFVWEPGEMTCAVRLGPGPASAFLDRAGYDAAVAAIQPIADELLADAERLDDADAVPEPRDELDTLR